MTKPGYKTHKKLQISSIIQTKDKWHDSKRQNNIKNVRKLQQQKNNIKNVRKLQQQKNNIKTAKFWNEMTKWQKTKQQMTKWQKNE